MKYTIYKNKLTGYYHLNVRLNGQRLRPSLGTTDKRAASIEAELRIKELLPGSITERVTLYRFLDLYKAHSLTRGKSRFTLDNETYIINTFKSLVIDRPLEKFSPVDANKFFSDLHTREFKRKDETVYTKTITGHGKNFYLRSLRMMWNIALDWKMVDSNPFNSVKRFATQAAPPRTLDDEEILSVFQALTNRFRYLVDVMLFLLLTGMRRNEALNLEWSEVNFKAKRITILKAKQRKFRVIPLFKIPREILKRRLPLKRPFADMPTGSTLTHDFADSVKDAKIHHAKLHDLRKTFGTMLARHNVNPYTIMQWLGHANADVTMTHYIGLDTDTAERLDDVGKHLAKKIYAMKVQKKY